MTATRRRSTGTGELIAARAGKGKRLGRPPTNGRAGSPHKKRPTLDARHPVHIVLRAIAAIGSLRRRDIYKTWLVDPFSTGALFSGWKELEGHDLMWKWRDTYDPMIVWLPKTWLLSDGWRRHGLIHCREVPSTNVMSRAR